MALFTISCCTFYYFLVCMWARVHPSHWMLNAVANLKGREGLRLAGHIPIGPAGPVGQPWIFPTTHLGPPTQHYLVSMVAISNGRGPLPTSPAQPRVSFWRGPDRRLPMGRYRAGMESSFWCWWLGARHLGPGEGLLRSQGWCLFPASPESAGLLSAGGAQPPPDWGGLFCTPLCC